jgi:predicted enzyme related to lactoylglutathione lyase
MPVNSVLAGLAVADVDAAVPWYERLLGRPADALPMEGLAEWHFPQSGAIQVIEDADRAGRSLLTLAVDDLGSELGTLRGLDPDAIDDTTSDKVLFATVTDPEGNTITLVEQR